MGEIAKSNSTEADPGTNLHQGHFDSELISFLNANANHNAKRQQLMDVTIEYLDFVHPPKLPKVVATLGTVMGTHVKPRPPVIL